LIIAVLRLLLSPSRCLCLFPRLHVRPPGPGEKNKGAFLARDLLALFCMAKKKTGISLSELRDLNVFDWIPGGRLDLLGRSMTELQVRKGEVIYRPGDPAEDLFCILEGEVGLSLSGRQGRFLRLALLARGEFFGVSALVPGQRRVSQAMALRESRVAQIQARTFVTKVCGLSWEIFSRLTEVTLKPLLLVSLRRALFLVERLSDRVALALWEYAGHPEARRRKGVLPSTLTHEELSAVVGASRPRVSLALRELEGRGFFVRKEGRIQVQERALHAYLEREYEFLL